jgi:hypothetical protein
LLHFVAYHFGFICVLHSVATGYMLVESANQWQKGRALMGGRASRAVDYAQLAAIQVVGHVRSGSKAK